MDAVEIRSIAKVTGRLVPFLIVCYFVAYLDRVNVGFAALTMNQDLGLSQTAFGFGAAIPLSTVIGAPVSGILLYLHGGLGLAGWQWLFIIEGPCPRSSWPAWYSSISPTGHPMRHGLQPTNACGSPNDWNPSSDSV